MTKDYKCTDCIGYLNGRRVLFVKLHTPEFGVLTSRYYDAPFEDKKNEPHIFNQLANEIIELYEEKLMKEKDKNFINNSLSIN